jgi:hypothetical protein
VAAAVMHEDVHERASQNEEEWPVREEMCAVLHPEEKQCDRKEAREGDFGWKRPAGSLGMVRGQHRVYSLFAFITIVQA